MASHFTTIAETNAAALSLIPQSRVIGYYSKDQGSATIGFCDSTFVGMTISSSTLGQCCDKYPCSYPYFAARGKTMWYQYSVTSRSGSSVSSLVTGTYVCAQDVVTLSLYQFSGVTSATNATTFFWCSNTQYMSQVPPETILYRDLASVPLRATSSSSGFSLTSAATSIATGTAEPTPSPESTAPSRVWIVGAVLGPVVACVFVAALVFFLMKRKYRKKSFQGVPQGGYPHGNDQMAIVSGHESIARSDGTKTGNGLTHGTAPYGHGQGMAGSMYDFDEPVRVR